MGLSVILVECDVTSPAGITLTLRFSDRAVFPMGPGDAVKPNVAWDERIIETPSLRRFLFDDLQTLQPGLGVGALTLANADHGLDAYQGHIWGEVRVWRWIYGTPFSTAKPMMRGPASGTPGYGVMAGRPGRVRLTLFDYRVELEKPLQTATYGGTNDGSTIFYDGDAALKGTLKPLAYGELLDAHLPGVLVNIGQQAYQLHDGPIVGLTLGVPSIVVFDRGYGAGLLNGGVTSSLAAFTTTNPATNYQTLYSTTSLTRFNANLVGTVTFSVFGDATGGTYVNTTGPILARLLARGGVPAGRIGASVAALASARVVGVYVNDATTVGQVVNFVASAAPAAILPDRLGVWQAVKLAPPAAIAALTLTEADLINLEADDGAVDGAGEFKVGWGRIWTTFRREALAPTLLGTAAERDLGQEYRTASLSDMAFQARFPAAWKTLKIDTALRHESDANALVADLKMLFGLRADGKPRRRWRATVEMTDAALDMPLGQTIAIAAPGFGVTDRFVLIGEELMRPRRDQVIWTLWG